MKRIIELSLIILGCLITGIASYQYYLHTPTYALRQISDAAERQDQVTLSKYVHYDSIVAGLMAPLERLEEASEKRAQDSMAEAKVAMRNSTAADDPLEKMKESELDLNFQSVKMRQRASLFALRMQMLSLAHTTFEHFDSDQVLNIKIVGNNAHVMIKDRDGVVFPITMLWEHKMWHVMQLELPQKTNNSVA